MITYEYASQHKWCNDDEVVMWTEFFLQRSKQFFFVVRSYPFLYMSFVVVIFAFHLLEKI